jgi:hypothetical protein
MIGTTITSEDDPKKKKLDDGGGEEMLRFSVLIVRMCSVLTAMHIYTRHCTIVLDVLQRARYLAKN